MHLRQPSTGAAPPTLGAPLLGLPGVGPRTAERLAAHGLHTREHALHFVPRRWDDLRALTPLSALVEGVPQATRAQVASARVVFGRRRFFEVVFVDEVEGARLRALWFHFRGSMKERFAPGRRVLLVGVPRRAKSGLQVVHPETVLLDEDEAGDAQEAGPGVRVRYPEIEGVPAKVVARLCRAVAEAHAHELPDGVPERILRARGWPSQGEALAQLHLVSDDAGREAIAALTRGDHPAQVRLAFDELFFLQLALARRRALATAVAGPPLPETPATARALARFLDGLGFAPTSAQRRAVDEIARDLARPRPMQRLLQGDVGAGKTVVMYAAAERAMASGLQVAVMAPTEILAEQHARTIAPWAAGAGRRTALLTASAPRSEREATLAALADGSLDLVIGTHALLADRVRFARLGLAVVDEQHRFGVAQRAALREKGAGLVPHLLVMTATPIPRTLALTAWGDLDLTTLDERPPGRLPPATELHLGARGRARALDRLAAALDAGRKGYVVCPRVDPDTFGDPDDQPDADGDVASAIATRDRLAARFPSVEVGLLHGRLPPSERDAAMRRFRSGEVSLLVATTVIEVGVDVPDADVMLVEGAERFGLSQLHQLRGRIGRGGGPSLCLLVTDTGSRGRDDQGAIARARLEVLTREHDGFAIAEADLRLRGPGELLGTRQSGLPRLRFSDPARDLALLEDARREAFALLDADPALALPEHAATRLVLESRAADGALSGPAG